MSSEKELVEYIARALVDEPDEVSVTQLDGEQATVLELRVAKRDMGRVIGKQGKIANAIRLLVNASTILQNKRRVVLEIIE